MSRQNLMTILFILIILATGYIWFFYISPKQSKNEAVDVFAQKSSLKTDIIQLRRIRSLKLDTGIFEDKFFRLLQQSSQPPIGSNLEEKTGRTNPFIPF